VALENAVFKVDRYCAISPNNAFKSSPNTADCILVPSTPCDEPKYTFGAVKAIYLLASALIDSLAVKCIVLFAPKIIASSLALNNSRPELSVI